MRRVTLTLLLSALAAPWAAAQGPPLQCTTQATPVMVRAEGETERAADIELVCQGGIPTLAGNPVPQINLQVFFVVNATSRILGPPVWSEALLTVDKPIPAAQLMCGGATGICPVSGGGNVYDGAPGHANVFQARQAGANSLVWVGVPFDPPGAGTRRLTLTNLRVNARQLGLVPSGPPVNINAVIAIQSTFIAVPVNNPSLIVATSTNGLAFSATPPPDFPQCLPQNVNLALNHHSAGTPQLTLTFTELFASAFKKRTRAPFVNSLTSPPPLDQNAPNQTLLDVESIFFNQSFPNITSRGNLAAAGIADNGTRLLARFAGVPAGVKLFAPSEVQVKSGSGVTGVMRLLVAYEDGTFPFTPSVGSGSNGLAPLPLDSLGSPYAVYEILDQQIIPESADVPIYVAYSTVPPPASVTVTGAFAAQNNTGVASATAPIPRFDNGITLAAFSISACAPQTGRMTGGGSVFTSAGVRATHGFELKCNASAAPQNLEINWDKGRNFKLTGVTFARCSDDPAIDNKPPNAGFDTYTGRGTGKLDGVAGATAEWVFTDAGEPGSNDSASILIKNPSGAVVLSVSGNIRQGNHQAHK